jgi:hypothetical protein
VEWGARNREQANADQGRNNQAHQEEIGAPFSHRVRPRVAVSPCCRQVPARARSGP